MSGLYTRFASGVLFPIHERLKHHDTVAVLRELESTQWWSAAQLHELQSRRLQALVRRAAAQVPYYRRVFAEAGVRPESIQTPEDLARLPLLDKPAIRAAGDDLLAQDHGRVGKASTSGSTGDPLKFWLGNERVSHDVAAKWRATRWWGVDIGDRELVVWASPIEASAQDRLRAWRDRLLRSSFVNAKDLSFTALEALLARIKAERPTMLFAYTGALVRLSRLMEAKGWTLALPELKVIFVTTERLDDADRALIARRLGAPVANGYGGRDAGFLAHDCPAGGMHLTAEDVIVELLDESGRAVAPGQPGEVVVTHLASGDAPFIRYRTGDIAELATAPCACGRGLPCLQRVLGRSNDALVGRGGRSAHYTVVSHLIKELPGLHAFKVIQESFELVRLQMVIDQPPAPAVQERIRAGLAHYLGEPLELRIEQVAEIPTEASGKHKHIVSRVPREAAEAAA